MNTISEFLSNDHQRCDDLFIAAETAVATSNWEEARSLFGQFCDATQCHFAMEEDVLFPAFETQTGSNLGPTAVMRKEHQQIRGLLCRMAEALDKADKLAYLGYSETLNIMMQQHNLKEESVLYQMADRVLRGQAEQVMDAMHHISSVT
ncbi:MAG: hemerythrin domain-containing protein [Burkholderiaceae bacterium]